VVDGPDRLI
jgi:hypothetical protein